MTLKTSKKTLLSAASTFVLLTVAAVGATRWVETRTMWTAAQAGVGVGQVDANLLTGRITLRDVSAPLAGGRAHIGSVTLNGGPALVTPALAAENVTLNDITFDTGIGIYRVPRAEVTGSSLNQQQLLGLFDKNASEPAAKRFAQFSATGITIPELSIEQTVQGNKSTIVYREVALRDIVSGKIGSLTVAGATMVGNTGPAALTGTFGPMAVKDFDVVLTLRLYTDKAGPDDKTPRVVYSNFSMDKMAFTDGKGVKFSIDRVTGGGFKAKPGTTPWLDVMKSIMETKDFDKLPVPEQLRFGAAMLDLFDSFEFGSMEVVGMTIDTVPPEKPVTAKIGRMAFTGGEKAEARLEGIDIGAPDVQVRLGLMSFSGFSLKPTLDAAREVLAKPDMKPAEWDPRKFMPVFGTMRIADIKADVPNEKVPNERIKLSVKGAEVTANQPLNGLPTNVRWAVNNLALTIPPGTQEDGLKELLEMGYKAIDVSTVIESTWNEPQSELAIKEVSFEGVDMGLVVVRAVLGNITKDVFSSDAAMAQVAAMGATAKSLSLNVENKGGFERGVAMAAKQQGRTPDDLRKELGTAATIMLPAVLGDSAGAKAIAAAVAKFVVKPGKLAITVTAKDKAGLGVADFMATGGDPTALFGKVDVTATAQ